MGALASANLMEVDPDECPCTRAVYKTVGTIAGLRHFADITSPFSRRFNSEGEGVSGADQLAELAEGDFE